MNQILNYKDDGTWGDDTLINLTVKLSDIREVQKLISQQTSSTTPTTSTSTPSSKNPTIC